MARREAKLRQLLVLKRKRDQDQGVRLEAVRADSASLSCTAIGLALQLRFLLVSESMGLHDSEVMDDRCIDRGDA